MIQSEDHLASLPLKMELTFKNICKLVSRIEDGTYSSANSGAR